MKRIYIVIIVLVILFSGCANQPIKKELNPTTAKITGEADKGEKQLFQIDYDFVLIKNNHVGDEWSCEVYYKGKPFYSGDTIKAEKNSEIILICKISEDDFVSDKKEKECSIILRDGAQIKEKIKVLENYGRYAGNSARWKLVGKVSVK